MSKINFISGAEFSLQQLKGIIDMALAFKGGAKLPDLSDKILTLFFANPSLRTRLSFESGMKKMKGGVNVLFGGDTWDFEYQEGVIMNASKQEHIKEAARVISRYTDVFGMRKSELMTKGKTHKAQTLWSDLKKDEAIQQFAKYATVPIINMESNMFHPCQAMADVMTLFEKFKEVQNKKYVLTWAPHPKALPLATPHSQLLTPAIFGMNVRLVHPEGFYLDPDVMKEAEARAMAAGGSVKVFHDQKEAFKDAEVVVAKSWGSLQFFGDWKKEAEHRAQFKDWTVDQKKMAWTKDAFFMHCLPVRRNVVVSDEVLDSERSLIIDEAENRMWVQMAILNFLIKQNYACTH